MEFFRPPLQSPLSGGEDPWMLGLGQCRGRGSEQWGRLATRASNWRPLNTPHCSFCLSVFREEHVAWLPSRTHVRNCEHIKKVKLDLKTASSKLFRFVR